MPYTVNPEDVENDWVYGTPYAPPRPFLNQDIADLNPAAGPMRQRGFKPFSPPDNPLTRSPYADEQFSPDIASGGAAGLGTTQEPVAAPGGGGEGGAAQALSADALSNGGGSGRVPPPAMMGTPMGNAAPPAKPQMGMPPPPVMSARVAPPGADEAAAMPQPQMPAARTPMEQAKARAQETLAQPMPQMRGGKLGTVQRLGMALLSATRLAPFAQQIIYPQYSRQMQERAIAGQELKELAGVEEQGARAKWMEQQARTMEEEGKKRYLTSGGGVFDVIERRWVEPPKSKAELTYIDPAQAKELHLAPLPDGSGFAIPNAAVGQYISSQKEQSVKTLENMVTRILSDDTLTPEQKQAKLEEVRNAHNLLNPDKPIVHFETDEHGNTRAVTTSAAEVAAAGGKQEFGQIGKPQQGPQPPQSLMIGPDGKAILVRPGMTVPQGAQTPQGVSSVNTPTAATRTMAEKAPRVLNFVTRINQLLDENEKQLGPLASRWNEFTAGKIGVPNKGYMRLRTDFGLLHTALMNMHVGARGGERIMEHFASLINLAQQDPENLRAALDEIKTYAEQVALEGTRNPGADAAGAGATPPAPNSVPQVGGTFNGEKVKKVTRIQ